MPELKSEFYDLEMLYEQVGNDADSLKRFVDIFLDTVPNDMEKLQHAIFDEDFDAVRAAAHKMKSSFLLMGAAWATDLCLDMETKGRHRIETEKLPEKFRELSEKFSLMVKKLAATF